LLLPLFVKFVATALVFVLVTETVARSGPRLGGVLAGLPMVLGPGFFFLGLDHPPAFVSGAAVAALHALAATTCLVGFYVLAARRLSASASMAAATTGWFAAVTVFNALPGGWLLALLAYVSAFVAWLVLLPGSRQLSAISAMSSIPARTGWIAAAVWYRGALAGLLVAAASLLGQSLGPAAAGLVLGFPIGTVLILWSVHRRNGADVARATARAAMIGMTCLAVFAWILAALTGDRFGPMAVFPIALAASLVVNLALALWAGRGQP
jgi:hypothetical protein